MNKNSKISMKFQIMKNKDLLMKILLLQAITYHDNRKSKNKKTKSGRNTLKVYIKGYLAIQKGKG